MSRFLKVVLASLAAIGASAMVDSAWAFDIAGNKINCMTHKDVKWRVPVGVGVSCRFEITAALQRDLMTTAGTAAVCEPLAAAMDAAGGGAEDPVADAIAAVTGVGCPIALHQIIRTYDTCKGMKIEANAGAKIKSKPGFHMQFAGCL